MDAVAAPRSAETLFDLAPAPLCLVSASGRYERVNGAWEDLLGLSAAALSGCRLASLVHPDDAARADGELHRAAEPGRSLAFRHRTGDGSYRRLELRAARAGEGGSILLSAIDSSECERARGSSDAGDARYRALFERSPDGVVILDPATARPIEFNDQACRQLGYSREEFARLSLADLEASESPQECARHIRAILRDGRDDFETKQRAKGGEIRDVHVKAQALEVDGAILYHCIWRDVTDRARVQARLERALEENGNLLRELRHRIKNSLFMIGSMIHLMASDEPSEPARAALGRLESRVGAVAQLYALLGDAGSCAEIDLDEYCGQVARANEALAGQVRLVLDLEPIRAPFARAAAVGLVLTELLTNAFKYAFPAGPGTVAVSLRRTPGGAVLEVADDGAGMPPGLESAVGSGMGLRLARGFIAQIDGDFRMRSDGSGTRFALRFPLP